MKEKELELVYEAIDNHGDSFWNDPSEGEVMGAEDWNGYLFDDVVEMLEKNGYGLRIVKKE